MSNGVFVGLLILLFLLMVIGLIAEGLSGRRRKK